MLEVVKQPWLPHLCQKAEMDWGISCRCFVPSLKLHQEQMFRALPHLLACCYLPFSAWFVTICRVTLSLAYSPGWSGDGFVYDVWASEAELTATSMARSYWRSTMGSQELPVSQVCRVFYCSTAKLVLSWVQSVAFWYVLLQQQPLRNLQLFLMVMVQPHCGTDSQPWGWGCLGQSTGLWSLLCCIWWQTIHHNSTLGCWGSSGVWGFGVVIICTRALISSLGWALTPCQRQRSVTMSP